MADIMSIDKNDNIKHDSDDSVDSSPEGDVNSGAHDSSAANAQDSQPIKRKGGRKPIYATSEERKQRNRQAQAAFRERRTEYIKQLEETIRVHEQNLHNLQTAHRHAADECLMLRYKNSLLERILLEKGIDVQAELRAKTGSPSLGPTHMPQNLVQPPPIPRAILNRHHARRSNSSIAPKMDSITSLPNSGLVGVTPSHPTPTSVASPKSRPTPSSHSGSPTASTPTYGHSPAASGSDPSASIRPILTAPLPPPPPTQQQLPLQPPLQQVQSPVKPGQMGGPMAGMMAPAMPRSIQQQQQQQQQQQRQRQQQLQQQHQFQQQQQHQQHQQHQQGVVQQQQHQQLQQHQMQQHPHHPQHQAHPHHPPPMPHQSSFQASQLPPPRAAGMGPSSYYQVPGFQNHIEQLEQEYEAADDMLEDPNDVPDTPSAGPYPDAAYSTAPQAMNLTSPATSNPASAAASTMGPSGSGGNAGYPSMTQLLDPALDWDPFGLSASMQFPTQFAFDTSNTR